MFYKFERRNDAERQRRQYAFVRRPSRKLLQLRDRAEFSDYPGAQQGRQDVRVGETSAILPDGHPDRQKAELVLDAFRTSTTSPAPKERATARAFLARTRVGKRGRNHAMLRLRMWQTNPMMVQHCLAPKLD
ncbi:uncharacterized protein RCC_05315 [Ramularia collo-cygni]|uniref:Uncharacterized protein n=1 Tax=Ramularia collo-cygni TaxID=112498 RepID=A0A2D3VA03_9PEZI|nr:uncharacterized protein RCC_05315 [Ramularia collo-cygni]CZT19464.1 uncharacterized protein RCC_05315 [Ramularia collo-cygni]